MPQAVELLVRLDGVQYTNEEALHTITSLLERNGINHKGVLLSPYEPVGRPKAERRTRTADEEPVRRKKKASSKKTARKGSARKTTKRSRG